MNTTYLDTKLKDYPLVTRYIIKLHISILLGFLLTYVYDLLYFVLFIDGGSFRDFMLFMITSSMWFGCSIILLFKELKESW